MNILIHHGIKGQKWGVRRYQNPDGTLTAAGRKRLGYSESDGDTSNRKGLNDKQKKTLKIAAGVLGAAAVAAGTAYAAKKLDVKLTDSLVDQYFKKGNEYYNKYFDNMKLRAEAANQADKWRIKSYEADRDAESKKYAQMIQNSWTNIADQYEKSAGAAMLDASNSMNKARYRKFTTKDKQDELARLLKKKR